MKLTRAMTMAEGASEPRLMMVGAVGGCRPTGMCPITCTFCRRAAPHVRHYRSAQARRIQAATGIGLSAPNGARTALTRLGIAACPQ
jgi:hypothetical protein